MCRTVLHVCNGIPGSLFIYFTIDCVTCHSLFDFEMLSEVLYQIEYS